MSTIELSDLEYQVDHLLRHLERLKTENHSLRQELFHVTRERSELLEKNRKAAAKVKKTITQLKEQMS